MKITKAQLKETLRTIMKEESEYQQFFRKALDKAGKSITDMSDEEKKAFFTKIDAAWDAKGEKNEGNAFGAAVTAAKEKGEDSFEVGGKEYKVESVNEAKFKSPDYIISTTPASKLPPTRLAHADVSLGLKMAEKLKNYTLDVRHYNLIHANGKVALKLTPQGKTAVRVRTEDDPKYLQLIQKTVNDIVADYVSEIKESVNEALLPADTKVVSAFFDKKPLEGRNLNTDGKVLKTAGIGSQQMYIHTPKGVKMVGKITGKYAQSLVQFVNKNYKSDLVESKINEEKYTVIDPRGNSLGTGLQMQAASMAKKKGGEKAGYFVVPAKNALKARRALEKFKGDFKNPKLKDMMSDLFYENKSVNEGRAFINAAKKAKAEGKTEFEFNGKTYPVTIKD
jgi:hypothetical protein